MQRSSPPDLQLPDRSEDVKNLIVRISKFLRELSLEDQHHGGHQDLNLVRRRSLQTVAKLGDLRDTLVSIAKEKLSSKLHNMLASRPVIEESLLVDPSIRFFGAEWKEVSERWLKTVSDIHNILETLESKTLDIIQLNSIFSSLVRLETEISLHTEAVLSGRLTDEQKTLQYLQQQHLLTVPVKSRTVSKDRSSRKSSNSSINSTRSYNMSPTPSISPVVRSRSMKEKRSKKKMTGYKRSKTADLSNKLAPSPSRAGSQGDDLDIDCLFQDPQLGESRRKSSFIEHISNLFKSIL